MTVLLYFTIVLITFCHWIAFIGVFFLHLPVMHRICTNFIWFRKTLQFCSQLRRKPQFEFAFYRMFEWAKKRCICKICVKLFYNMIISWWSKSIHSEQRCKFSYQNFCMRIIELHDFITKFNIFGHSLSSLFLSICLEIRTKQHQNSVHRFT